MTNRQKVRAVYPDAYCLVIIAPIGNSYQVIFDNICMPTHYWITPKDAWKEAWERISKALKEKLES